MSETLRLLYDGDIRGYRTGMDCARDVLRSLLEKNYAGNVIWKDGIARLAQLHEYFSQDDSIMTERDSIFHDLYIDEVIGGVEIRELGKVWHLIWLDGSIFAVSHEHVWEGDEA